MSNTNPTNGLPHPGLASFTHIRGLQALNAELADALREMVAMVEGRTPVNFATLTKARAALLKEKLS